MEDCEIIPLCKNSKILVYNPKIEFFYKKIKKSDFFSSPRQQHAVWDAILSVTTVDEFIPANFSSIAENIEKKAGGLKGWKAWNTKKELCEDLFWFISSKKPPNLLYAVSDVGLYVTDLPPHEIDIPYNGKDMFGPRWGFRQRQELIKKILPPDEIPLNGVIWRKYALNGQLQKFISDHKSKKIVVIGPWYFKDFNIRAQLEDYDFIEIDYYKASEKYQETYDAVLNKKYENALCFIVGGLVGNWLAFKLHSVFLKNFIIDIGRALDVYYKELAQQMNWRWLYQ